VLKIIGIISLSLIIVVGVVVSRKQEVKTVLDKVGPNQIGWVFFEDSNANGEFDNNEPVFKSVSVAVRRPGEMAAFITVPAEVNGLVKIDGLETGRSYETQYLNYELEQPYEIGEWALKRYYQIIEAGKSRYSFLPTEWQTIELTSTGFKAKVGLREYQPESVLVIKEGKGVKFYEPVRAKILGQSQFEDETERQFYLKDNQVYYLVDKQLKQFSFKDKLSAVKIDRLYGVKPTEYWLSADGEVLVYADEEGRWQYESGKYGCEGGGAEVETGGKLVDIAKDGRAVIGDNLITCLGKDKLTVRKLNLSGLTSVNFLNDQTLFYSNDSGSYFYDWQTDKSTKYTALGNGAKAVVSEDGKYIGAKLNGSIIVVDYPAVMASGVEKHYLLPFSGQIVFSRDEVLINQSKSCQPDGDCGEIIRVELKGNGVWEIKDRIELKDIQADELLGEIRLN
jgi:hypothetical protein